MVKDVARFCDGREQSHFPGPVLPIISRPDIQMKSLHARCEAGLLQPRFVVNVPFLESKHPFGQVAVTGRSDDCPAPHGTEIDRPGTTEMRSSSSGATLRTSMAAEKTELCPSGTGSTSRSFSSMSSELLAVILQRVWPWKQTCRSTAWTEVSSAPSICDSHR